jgi:predicted nuclease of restriction endonuclease-like (RecB) superfamily
MQTATVFHCREPIPDPPSDVDAQAEPTGGLNYEALLQSIVDLHNEALGRAALAVNRSLVLRNWLIGAYLVEFEQGGADRAAYGAGLLARLSRDLRRRDVKGVSPDVLERMRAFYLRYPQLRAHISATPSRKLPTPPELHQAGTSAMASRKSETLMPTVLPAERILQLSWSHLVELVRLDDPWKRAFYENECLMGNWSVRQLQRQIGSLLYERTGLSTDKRGVIEAARAQAAGAAGAIADLIRDPYVLEFVGLAEKPRYRESDLERALLDHLQTFLLELGTGFCFEARQRRITVGTEHDYVDLVFYHRRLRCHLLIDLKVRAFRHGDVGQMNFYLNYWKANEVEQGDNPPVGLLLCSSKDQTEVEYATAGLDQQLFVSRYLVALPSPQQLRALVEADRLALESRGIHHAKGEEE